MSLSQPKLNNPCHKFIEFKGDTGVFRYWKKGEEKGKGENVVIPMPITFIVLDELSTITGFSDEYQAGIYSNEVHNLTEETLTVRVFKGKAKVVGLYAGIKGDIAQMGGKFTKSVYASLIHNDGSIELVNFQLKGISFKSWIDCGADKNGHAITVSDCSDGKKGNVKYKMPNFRQAEIPKGVLEKAVAMDKALQSYLKEYTNQQIVKYEGVQADVPVVPDLENDDIPF